MIPRLIGFSPGADGSPRDLQSLVEAGCRGGMDGLILHAKHPDALHIAVAAGWGLHLPSGKDPAAFRSQITGLLGMSCHSLQTLLTAAAAGCDYACLSPIFPPHSKPEDTREALGVTVLAEAAKALRLPIIALGGMTPQGAVQCTAAGAHGVASMGALFAPGSDPEDTHDAARALRAAMAKD